MELWNNPYAPGAGTPPPELAGRDTLLDNARSAVKRSKSGRVARSFIVVGLRGVGKTVLLNEAQAIADAEYAITDCIEVGNNDSFSKLIIPTLRSILLKLDRASGVNGYVKKGLRVLKSFIGTVKLNVHDSEVSLDIDAESGIADSGVLSKDLADTFVAVGESAKSCQTSIVILVDEIHNLPLSEFEALIMAIHRTNQKGLPLLVIGAGLPSLVRFSGNAKTYAERLFEYPEIGPLDFTEAKRALVIPAIRENVEFEEAAISEVVSQTQGYPYFLQEWGYQVWNTAESSPITLADIKKSNTLILGRLEKIFFRSRYERVSDAQMRYLKAMARSGPGPHRTGQIAQAMGKSSRQVSSVREALIHSGMIYSPKYGLTAFTVPLFDEFMNRVQGARSP